MSGLGLIIIKHIIWLNKKNIFNFINYFIINTTLSLVIFFIGFGITGLFVDSSTSNNLLLLSFLGTIFGSLGYFGYAIISWFLGNPIPIFYLGCLISNRKPVIEGNEFIKNIRNSSSNLEISQDIDNISKASILTFTPNSYKSKNTHHPEIYIQKLATIDKLRAMHPVEFEKLIEKLFKKMGFSVETTPITGDEGVDLLVRKGNRKGIVQCKRYQGSVGQPIVRDLYGAMVHNRADEAYVITTGTISLPAQQWASGKPIHLVDGNTLLEWLNSFDTEDKPTAVNS